jgi:hypothetical protein
MLPLSVAAERSALSEQELLSLSVVRDPLGILGSASSSSSNGASR